jgi:hypothetical protein
MTPLDWILLLFVAAVANQAYGLSQLQGYLAGNPKIWGERALDEFKALVRRQMIQALLQLLLLGGMGVIGLLAIVDNRLDAQGMVAFISLNLIVFALGSYGKRIEERTRSLEVTDPALAEAYQAVCRSWLAKALPDF